jgi:hypothetical protein
MPLIRCPACGGQAPYCSDCGYSGTKWAEPEKDKPGEPEPEPPPPGCGE